MSELQQTEVSKQADNSVVDIVTGKPAESVDDVQLVSPLTLSAEELNRRQEISNAQMSKVYTSEGNIIAFENLPDSDYIIMVTDVGVRKPIHRKDLLIRAKAVYDMIHNETGSGDPAQVDKWIWLCVNGFKTAIENGRKRGKNYNSDWIKSFERGLLQIEKVWRNKSDYKNK